MDGDRLGLDVDGPRDGDDDGAVDGDRLGLDNVGP